MTDPLHKFTNRLSRETSPYLLQHQHNAVDWYAWGDEAFAAARRENKPIFLSVGYSTCYWCHVMERQCFENEAIAAEMTKRFISIKVDREERPDVDQLYMTAVQVLTRQGGWPMSVFLLPDLRPFYGGTYFPPTDSHGRPGFPRLLEGLEDAYKNRLADVEKSANSVLEAVTQLAKPAAGPRDIHVNQKWLDALIERSTADYDPNDGGFGSAPKFPRQTLVELLLVHHQYFPNDKRLAMIQHSLDAMANGGIRDQLGGGFHRYSTDGQWLVPHFEIMLYDNALLAWCYTDAFRQTQEPRYAAVAKGIFDFVLREMTSADGSFYTALDAEVDAQEGMPYLWTRAEVEATLAEKLGTEPIAERKIAKFVQIYGLDDGPNFADPHNGSGMAETNVLFIAEPEGLDGHSPLLDPEMAELRAILYSARRLRKQPLLDTKIITSWNGLMIRALAFGGQVFNEQRYVDAGAKAAEFILAKHQTAGGGLFRTSRDGSVKYAGFLDDYAFFIQGLIALCDVTADQRWRDHAYRLCVVMNEKFVDSIDGGFYFTEVGATDLIVRQKVASDSPLPSGNGVAAMVNLVLKQTDIAKGTIAVFAQQLQGNAEGMSAMLRASVQYLQDHESFLIPAGNRSSAARQITNAVVKLKAEWKSATTLDVIVNIADGFHINSHTASAGLLATQLSITGEDAPQVSGILYPDGTALKMEFAEFPIDVYTGQIAVTVQFVSGLRKTSKVKIALIYQACNKSACLAQQTEVLEAIVP